MCFAAIRRFFAEFPIAWPKRSAEATIRGRATADGIHFMRMFGASRFTIREALAELRSRGLIASCRTISTFSVMARSPSNSQQ